jgi:adenine-specific DNA-methyltransferase
LYAPRDDAHIQKGERAFYTRENAILLDSARRALDAVVPARYFNLVLAPLLTEASIHVNTAGVFKGFFKG